MNRVHIALIIFKDAEGKMLLHSRDNAWSLLGGGVEDGELPIDAIAREMNEEIGLDLKHPVTFVKSHIHPHSDDKEYELHLFEAEFPGFEGLVDTEEVKLSELKFFSSKDIAALDKLLFAKLIFDDLHDMK